jgi:hypothetical protein
LAGPPQCYSQRLTGRYATGPKSDVSLVRKKMIEFVNQLGSMIERDR